LKKNNNNLLQFLPKPLSKRAFQCAYYTIATLLFLFIICQASASGIENNGTAQKAMSLAGTFTGIADDASALYFNPGGIAFSESHQIAIGTTMLMRSTSFLSPYSGNHNLEDKTAFPLHLYAAFKVGELSTVGLSVNSPYRSESQWQSEWPGRYVSTYYKFTTTYVQPTYSILLNEKFGVGIGGVIGFSSVKDELTIPVSDGTAELTSKLDATTTSFGINVGLLFKMNDETSLGLSFKSGMKHDFSDGTIKYNNIPSSLLPGYPNSAKGSLVTYTPNTISLGGSHLLTKQLLLAVEFKYALWSSSDTVGVEVENYPDRNYGVGLNHENAFSLSAGAEYEVSDDITVRAGVGYDLSPVKNDYLNPRMPDADKYKFSAGGTFRFNENFSIAIAYMLENFTERESTNIQYNFNGTYKSYNHLVGITLNYDI